MTRDVLDERQILGGVVDALPAPLPSVLGGLLGLNSSPTAPASTAPPSTPPPSTPPPSTAPSPTAPAPTAPASTPPASTVPPSTPSPSPPPTHPSPSPSTAPPSPFIPPSTASPSPFTPLSTAPSTAPPSTPSPPSSPPPSNSAPAPVQNPNSTGGGFSPSTASPSDSGGSSPSPSGGSSPSPSGGSSPSPSGSSPFTGSPSNNGGSSISDGSNLSSTTPPDPPSSSSPSTQNGSSLGTSPTTVTGGSISSSISSTTGGSLDSASTSISNPLAPPITDVGTSSSSALPDTIPTQSPVIISGSPSLINDPSFTNGPNGAGPTNNVSSALADPHHQLSPGEIAAIIIVLLIFFVTLPVAVFILRRRSRIHRADRSTRWWFATTRSSQIYGDGATEQLIPPETQTARSSFVTTIDHSESTRPTYPTYVIPPFPPAMAEMGRGNASRPTLVINLEGNGNNNLEESRYSIGSAGSDHSQYLIVHHRNSINPDQPTPMSVRPFSPSESFAFPKPPEPAAAGSASASVAGGSTRPTSSATSVTLAAPPLPPGLLSIPSLVPLVVSNSTKSSSSAMNPFEDPTTPTIESSPYSDFSVEVVRRPFEPTLPDELAVKLDDRVRVLHRFDDGWGLIEKVRKDGREGEKGVIPMDCLRKTVEELEELGAGRRTSSCEGPCAF